MTVMGGSTVESVIAEALTTVPGTTVSPELTTVTTRVAASATKKSSGPVLVPNSSAFVSALLLGLVLRRVLF